MEENGITPEMIAEMEAQKNQELYGPYVQKINGCAVVTAEEEVVSLELPIEYNQLVSAIVARKYGTDKTEAIVANYLTALSGEVTEEKAAEYKVEYQQYQAWRATAKSVAKATMGIED